MNPLQIRQTGKDGKVEFNMYVDGDIKVIKSVIRWLENYVKLSKENRGDS